MISKSIFDRATFYEFQINCVWVIICPQRNTYLAHHPLQNAQHTIIITIASVRKKNQEQSWATQL